MWGLKLIHMVPSHWPLEPQKRTMKKTPHKPLGKLANLCPGCSLSKSHISPLMNLLENPKDEKGENSQIKKYSTTTTPRYAPGWPGVSLGHKAKLTENVCVLQPCCSLAKSVSVSIGDPHIKNLLMKISTRQALNINMQKPPILLNSQT